MVILTPYHTSWAPVAPIRALNITTLTHPFSLVSLSTHYNYMAIRGYNSAPNLVRNLFPAISNLIWTFSGHITPHSPQGPLPEPENNNRYPPSLTCFLVFLHGIREKLCRFELEIRPRKEGERKKKVSLSINWLLRRSVCNAVSQPILSKVSKIIRELILLQYCMITLQIVVCLLDLKCYISPHLMTPQSLSKRGVTNIYYWSICHFISLPL